MEREEERVRLQLAEVQLVESYCKAMKLHELPVPNANRPERDWDKLFERLEERFLIVGDRLSCDQKCLCVCRVLRGVPLQVWHDLGSKTRSYEARRDAFMLVFFPVAQEFSRLCRLLSAASAGGSASSVPGGGSGSLDAGVAPPVSPRSPETDTTAATAGKAVSGGRLSLPAVRAQVCLQRARLERIVSRHRTLCVPAEPVFIAYAVSLMKPALASLAADIPVEPALSLEAFLDLVAVQLAQTPAFLEKPPKQRMRRGRRGASKGEVVTTD
eukprot:Gregarina_sp_Pseudo_9__5831@NODE_894_length_2082_cov_290_939794_g839_i0_p1_GENE_NODE_894_length_2082_cov_290_939794_g839_i0NODE_894_length_2082_cov_290_939794_g839_i0_p1_ORF_typecomplete_len271_score77_14_NODE_894_length_2082_cov_290_939794_g839_i04361248